MRIKKLLAIPNIGAKYKILEIDNICEFWESIYGFIYEITLFPWYNVSSVTEFCEYSCQVGGIVN